MHSWPITGRPSKFFPECNMACTYKWLKRRSRWTYLFWFLPLVKYSENDIQDSDRQSQEKIGNSDAITIIACTEVTVTVVSTSIILCSVECTLFRVSLRFRLDQSARPTLTPQVSRPAISTTRLTL